MLKIYLVERTDEIGWDEYSAWIVVARNPKEAKSLCDWGDGTGDHVKVSIVKKGRKPHTVLGSFHAG